MWWKWARAACLILKFVTGPEAFLNIESKMVYWRLSRCSTGYR